VKLLGASERTRTVITEIRARNNNQIMLRKVVMKLKRAARFELAQTIWKTANLPLIYAREKFKHQK
jgi:hypothetical protein